MVDRGRCPEHAREVDRARGSRIERGYSNRWARRAKLFRDHFPLCGMRPGGLAPVMSECFNEGAITLAVLVDHVVPHKGDPVLFWNELENWQSLCARCHSRKTSAGF